MDEQPKVRNRVIKENKFGEDKFVGKNDVYTLEADKAGDYVPSLNKINKENNPQ